MSANQYKVTLHLQRRRKNKKLGLITRGEIVDVYQKICEAAAEAGFEAIGSV